MTHYPNASRIEARPDSTWLWVEAANWWDCASWLKTQGLVRCEWLAGAHLGDDLFQVTLCVSDVLAEQRTLVVTEVNQEIDSIGQVYPIAQFHEREMKQMLGLEFTHLIEDSPAFNTDFGGYPLRRDFALTERTEHEWPGQVDPEKATKRRPALAPGVRQEWLP